ncbi:MAG: hypothetical protein JF888_02390 [Candidatus Dormibacteraeota bacterium]|uniref:Uncharacterized protein n=1 Tax=Candidatus Dormiibacter inghamiae TaxID=3127013 RepID=A0A934K5F9_9BACT|nr:hypothetical protein [Candidatus Dormibacteraeota bacterium]MBJ7605429.1 hypothetical protein [Candidatus Dormibacteraeota bacterium]
MDRAPIAFALALFAVAALTTSQSGVTRAIVPIGIALGTPGAVLDGHVAGGHRHLLLPGQRIADRRHWCRSNRHHKDRQVRGEPFVSAADPHLLGGGSAGRPPHRRRAPRVLRLGRRQTSDQPLRWAPAGAANLV